MSIKQFNKLIVLFLTVVVVASCSTNSDQSSFEIKGKLNGMTDGKVIFKQTRQQDDVSDTVLVENGEFIYTADITTPVEYEMSIDGTESRLFFYAENTKMTITGHVDSLWMANITGGTINDEQKTFRQSLDNLARDYKLDSLAMLYMKDTSNAEVKQKYIDASEKYSNEYQARKLQYVKEHPASYYSAILVGEISYQKDAVEIEKFLAMLDPKLNDFSVVEELREEINNLKTTDISLDEFIGDTPDVEYTVDNKYLGNQHKNIQYLAALSNDNLCALTKDGNIITIDPSGKKIGEFKSTLKSIPSSIAIDEKSGNIYVLGTNMEVKERKVRGRSYRVENENGVECIVYDSKGTELKNIKLEGIKSATGAKVINDNLIVADFSTKKIVLFDQESGKKLSSIENLRACCKILDFGVNKKNEILVANLGAFRVQAFDYSGKIKYAFGRRGSSINEFHGCCNPVNTANLNNGAIVTVEKDPTRIKVYTKSGARQIEGIQELVKGCTYIPMTSDSKNNFYLASAQSGIVKCVVKSLSK